MTNETVQMPVVVVEKKPEKVKMTKEERAAKKAAADLEKKQKAEERAAKKAAAELEKKQKAEERAAKKAAAELEKTRKAEERDAKKAAAELKKTKKAEQHAANKAAKEEKKTITNQLNIASSLQEHIDEIRGQSDEELQEEEEENEVDQESPNNLEEDKHVVLPAVAEMIGQTSPPWSVEKTEPATQAVLAPPNSPIDVPVVVESLDKKQISPLTEEGEIGQDDDESVSVDFALVESKLDAMKKMILMTRANLKQLEACYVELANCLGTDATM